MYIVLNEKTPSWVTIGLLTYSVASKIIKEKRSKKEEAKRNADKVIEFKKYKISANEPIQEVEAESILAMEALTKSIQKEKVPIERKRVISEAKAKEIAEKYGKTIEDFKRDFPDAIITD